MKFNRFTPNNLICTNFSLGETFYSSKIIKTILQMKMSYNQLRKESLQTVYLLHHIVSQRSLTFNYFSSVHICVFSYYYLRICNKVQNKEYSTISTLAELDVDWTTASSAENMVLLFPLFVAKVPKQKFMTTNGLLFV